MGESTGMDLVYEAALFAGMAFIVNFFVGFLLYRFVALNSPPERRAFWTVFPGYIAAGLAMVFGMSGLVSPLWSPIVPLPGALLMYWWLVRDLRKGWIENPEDLPDGVKLANSDWRMGLAGVAALIVAAAIRVMIRRSM